MKVSEIISGRNYKSDKAELAKDYTGNQSCGVASI